MRIYGHYTPQEDEPTELAFDGYTSPLSPNDQPHEIFTPAELDALKKEIARDAWIFGAVSDAGPPYQTFEDYWQQRTALAEKKEKA